LEAVFGLRESYRQSGGDMLIGYGRPEILLPSLLDSLGSTSDIAGVWSQEEITVEEANVLSSLRQALKRNHNKTELHTNDSKTMIPTKHLPFDPKDTPDVYTAFRKKVEGLGLGMGGGMLVEPLKTASWDEGSQAIKVSVEGKGLRPFPDLPNLDVESGQGGWLGPIDNSDSIEGMYTALSAPLFDSPPIGGWSSAANSPSSLPARHPHTAVPFRGSESSGLARLDDYVGRPNSSSGGWSGGSKARKYKSTRNGLLGDEFSTKFASFLSLGTLSAREAGWRVGSMLETLGKDKEAWNNVYCA
jgi:deoxyribodipyrimidine photo-lyase